MPYEGRSPLKDVARSVVIGAAMIPASMLAGCSRHTAVTSPPGTGSGSGTDGTPPTMIPTPPAPVDAGVDVAPPPDVVRPRADATPVNMMPTRGFAGGSRVRG